MRAIMLLGPTAVGKTDLLLELAANYPIEVISVDSRQLYRYMNIGTAKPNPEERTRLPHHLVDMCDPDEDFDVYRFRQLALTAEEDIRKRGKIPVFAGGSGLYADSLLKGLVMNVPKDDKVRTALELLEAEHRGLVRKLLRVFDPQAARRIHPNDMKKTRRYLEAFFVTGKRLSEIQQEDTISDRFTVILVERERTELHSRIADRTEKMRHLGLMREVEVLLRMGFSCKLNSMKTIGYSEVCAHLGGSYTEKRTFELVERNTRRYARRQIIWFRRYRDAQRLNLSFLSRSEVMSFFAGAFDSFWGDDCG